MKDEGRRATRICELIEDVLEGKLRLPEGGGAARGERRQGAAFRRPNRR